MHGEYKLKELWVWKRLKHDLKFKCWNSLQSPSGRCDQAQKADRLSPDSHNVMLLSENKDHDNFRLREI